MLMVEVMAEATYVPHHKKKIAFILSAMRHFAAELRGGWHSGPTTWRSTLPANTGQRFRGELVRAAARAGRRPHRRHRARRVARAATTCEAGRPRSGVAGRHPGRRPLLLLDRRVRPLGGGPQAAAHGAVLPRHAPPHRPADARRRRAGGWPLELRCRQPQARCRRACRMPAPARFAPDAVTREVLALVAARFADHFGDARAVLVRGHPAPRRWRRSTTSSTHGPAGLRRLPGRDAAGRGLAVPQRARRSI